MKSALTETGETIIADAGAPETAICPDCGCPVNLGKRQRMGGEATYFWRHLNNSKVPCRKRSRPFIRYRQG